MQIAKTHKIIISIVVLAILLSIYITFDKKYRKQGESNTDKNASTTVTDISGGKLVTSGIGDYTIEQVPLTEGEIPKPIPNLNRAVTPYAGVAISSENLAFVQKEVLALQTILKKDPSDLPSWINLGLYQKAGGDYEGAIISWKYASRLAPTDFVSMSNLGNLYAYFLKDNGQAEMYYLEALKRDPKQEYLYFQVVEVYRDIFKDISKVMAIVNQGLQKLPNNPNLLQLKESLK